MNDVQNRTLAQYQSTANQVAIGHIYQASCQLGLLESLQAGQKNITQLADTCQLQLDPLRRLLECLRQLGVIEQYEEDFALAPATQLFMQHENDLGSYRWEPLASVLREGAIGDQAEIAAFRNRRMAVQWATTAAALELVQVLGVEQQPRGGTLLDLGCGIGVWSMAIAHHDPSVQLTLADDPVTLAGARATATSIGLVDRITTLEGDYHEMELPAASFDMVLMTELLSLESVDGQRQLLARARQALKPTGELVLADLFGGQAEGELALSILSLEMGLASHDASPCDPHQLQQLLMEAGFEKPRYAHLQAPPRLYGAMVSRLQAD